MPHSFQVFLAHVFWKLFGDQLDEMDVVGADLLQLFP